MSDTYQRKNDCNNCGKPDCSLGYMTPIGFRLFCSPECGNNYMGYPENFDLELEEKGGYFFESESISEDDIYEIGSKVRSYDFVLGNKILSDDSFMEGYIVDFAPVPTCSPNCNHYHIDTTRIVRSGVEISPEDEGWAEFFTTHWDNYGVLLLEEPYEEDYMTSDWLKRRLNLAEDEEHPDGPDYCDVCKRHYGRVIQTKPVNPENKTVCLCKRKERQAKMEEESNLGRRLRKLREEGGLSTSYYDEEKPTTYDEYPVPEPSGMVGRGRRKENWPPTSGIHWYDEIGEQMTFWTIPTYGKSCIQCGATSSSFLINVRNEIMDEEILLCLDCINEQELLWWAITGVKPKGERANPLTKDLLAETFEGGKGKAKKLIKPKFYMVHKHNAKRAGLHYDLRLEENGVLKSWAIPKGMPKNGRHLAIQTPDHSMEYGKWEGTIKSGYGAGDVEIDTSGNYITLNKSSNNWKFKILTGKYKGVWRLTHWKGDKWLISRSRSE